MRLLAPILHLPGPGTSKELLAVQDERVELDPFPTPRYAPGATSPGWGCDDSDSAAVMLVSEESCSESGSSPSVLPEEDQAAIRNV